MVRGDLSPAQQAVQGAHAAVRWQEENPEYRHEDLILLRVRGGLELQALHAQLMQLGARSVEFRDWDNMSDDGFEITAVASGDPKAIIACHRLRLALSGEGVRR